MSYSNWNSGEPNNSGDEDCVHILEDINKWNDLSCASTNPYICQKPQGKSEDIRIKYIRLLGKSVQVHVTCNIATQQ